MQYNFYQRFWHKYGKTIKSILVVIIVVTMVLATLLPYIL